MSEKSADTTEQFVESLANAQSRLYGLILSLLGRPEEALDVLQETNVVLWRKLGEFDPSREFMPWAARIAHFQVMAYRRDRARHRHLFSDGLLEELSNRAQAMLPAQDDRLTALTRCMGKLPARQRELIESRYAEGGSVQALAARMQASPNAIRKTLHRIRLRLHECIRGALAEEAAS